MAPSVVIWGAPPFFGAANSVQSEMARAFRSLGCEVLCVELGGDARAFREALERSPGPLPLTALSPDGIVVARAPRLPLFPYAMLWVPAAINIRLAESQARRLAPIWAGGRSTTVFVHYGWFSGHLAERLREARHVLDCIDEHAAADRVEGRARRVRRVRTGEARLIRACELVVCVSRRLAERRAAAGARRVVVLPNGADPAAFEGARPEDPRLRGLARPRVLCLGRIGPKIDLELLIAAAREDPALSWVLAGEWTVAARHPLPPNVVALGRVSRAELPAIAAGCDAGVAPLKLTEWNLSSSPMKFGDYLAAGLPFVSTRIPAAEELAGALPGAVLFAGTGGELARAARAAASSPGELRSRCREYARAHSWRTRAQKVLDELGGPT